MTIRLSLRRLTYWTDYAKQDQPSDDELVIPEDLTELSDEDLAALHEQAVGTFNDLYDDGNVSAEDLDQLRELADSISRLREERDSRAAEQAERAEQAREIAAQVNPAEEPEAEENDGDGEAEDSDEDEVVATVDAETGEVTQEPPMEQEAEVEPIAASANQRRRGEVRINLSSVRSRQPRNPRPSGGDVVQSMRDLVRAAPDVPGFSNGQGMDFNDMGRAVNARLQTFQQGQYAAARSQGRHMRQQFGVAVINKPFRDGLTIESNDPGHIDEVFSRAVDESRLPGGSLVASGGWCAPSETLYDLFELEGRDGLFSLPEVNIARGGIRWTTGPDFASLFAQITGFHYTEAQDQAGEYGVDADGLGNDTEGSKPCYHIPCDDDWQEARLALDGLCITAGLLQQRGYPELIARTIRGALVAHDNRLAGRKLAAIRAGSTAVAMPAGQVGATAPVLTAIELQVEQYRQVHRMSRAQSLEAVFPFWIHGAIRSDLSRRLGTDLDPLSVTDAQINAWFAQRGVNAQFVYNLDDLTTDAAGTTQWPTEVDFLLYAAGTWVGGGSDVITLDTIYDSTLLGENDYTALFTEEGWLVAKRGHDSRVVSVPICPSGELAAGVAIGCDGTGGTTTTVAA